MTLGITKKEWMNLNKRGYRFSSQKPNGQEISGIIMIVHNPSRLHDSGFPYIRAFGICGKMLIDMGWHDHYLCYLGTNTDALGKNIFHVMPWGELPIWKIANGFVSCSSLMLRENGTWE